MSLRAVRSPLAPKMMMEHGSTTLRPSSRRQTINSSNCWDWFTRKPSSSDPGISNFFLFTSSTANLYCRHQMADVAELADALDSKSGTRKSVWVRPPPSAPLENHPAARPQGIERNEREVGWRYS